MEIGIKKSKRGILLTLAVVVLVVLMVAELVTYVYLNINYQTLDALGNGVSGSSKIVGTLNSSTAAFLRAGLHNALSTLSTYESGRKGFYINNTAYAISSLMTNGVIYGTNEIALMGGATTINYTNAIILQAKLQGFSLALTNASLQIYQSSPSSLNATYYALAVLNTSSSSFTYPIEASTGISLNGSADLYSVQNGDNYNIKFSSSEPSAVLLGNTYATSGSRAPFQFIYGTIIYANSLAACAGIPSKYNNANYILAVPNDVVGSCSFGGVVTYSASPNGYSVPYLVYTGSSNIMNYLYNGSSVLLNGPGLSLLNLSATQSAMQNGYYFGSAFTPAYLDWAQGSTSKRSQNGLFSFNLYNKQAAQFNGANSYINNGNSVMLEPPNTITIVAWINSANVMGFSPAGYGQSIIGYSPAGSEYDYWIYLQDRNINVVVYNAVNIGIATTSSPIALSNTWYQIAVTATTGGQENAYVDGVNVLSATAGSVYWTGGNSIIGDLRAARGITFNGMISDVQIYNSVLAPQQIYQLYLNGLEGLPIQTNSLVAWWPLDGNPDDYSGNGYNGLFVAPANTVPFRYITGYSGNPVYDGAFYGANLTNIIEGVSSCASINQCSNSTAQQFYLGPSSLSVSQGSALPEANALGLANAVIPNAAYFNGQGGYITTASPDITATTNLAISGWVYWEGGPSAESVIFYNGNTGSSGYGLLISGGACNSGNELTVLLGGISCSALASPPTMLADTWTFVTLTRDSNTWRLYVNGVLSGGTGSTNPNIPASPTIIGAGTGAGASFQGLISDVQVYNTVLTQPQVMQLYLNNSVIGVNAIDILPLSYGYNGLTNQTADIANALNVGLFSNAHGVCSNANVISRLCGDWFTQP